MNKKEIYESVSNTGIGWIDWIFNKTVDYSVYLGKVTGLGYHVLWVFILIIVVLIMFLSISLNVYFLKKLKCRSRMR